MRYAKRYTTGYSIIATDMSKNMFLTFTFRETNAGTHR